MPGLRKAICDYLRAARAVRREPEQIVVTAGTQHAIDLVIRVLHQGDLLAWIEDPGYALTRYALVAAGVIENASFIWWAMRPSLWHPTLELRIPDVCTRVEDGLCIAALFRCLTRHLFNHPELNADIGAIDRALAVENKWRAQRYGIKASFVERGCTAARTMNETVADLLDHTDRVAAVSYCILIRV